MAKCKALMGSAMKDLIDTLIFNQSVSRWGLRDILRGRELSPLAHAWHRPCVDNPHSYHGCPTLLLAPITPKTNSILLIATFTVDKPVVIFGWRCDRSHTPISAIYLHSGE